MEGGGFGGRVGLMKWECDGCGLYCCKSTTNGIPALEGGKWAEFDDGEGLVIVAGSWIVVLGGGFCELDGLLVAMVGDSVDVVGWCCEGVVTGFADGLTCGLYMG